MRERNNDVSVRSLSRRREPQHKQPSAPRCNHHSPSRNTRATSASFARECQRDLLLSSARLMKAVILCGGQGTRIRDASELLPKPMLPIGDKPMVWHIMKIYASYGVDEFVLCLGYKGWVIKEFFLNYRAMTCDLRVGLGDG